MSNSRNLKLDADRDAVNKLLQLNSKIEESLTSLNQKTDEPARHKLFSSDKKTIEAGLEKRFNVELSNLLARNSSFYTRKDFYDPNDNLETKLHKIAKMNQALSQLAHLKDHQWSSNPLADLEKFLSHQEKVNKKTI